MKRFFYLQLFLLTLGIGWLAYVFFNNVSLIVPVDFLCRLRQERRFESAEALRRQLEADRAEALRLLETINPKE